MSTSPLKSKLRTTSKYITILKEYGISTLKELLLTFPRTYEDRKSIKNLTTVDLDWSLQTVKWYIIKKSIFKTPTGKKISQIHFIDELETKWIISFFRGTHALRAIKQWKWYYIIGKPEIQYGKVQFLHPEFVEAVETDTTQEAYNFGRIYPVYSEMMGIKPARFARKIFDVLDEGLQEFTEPFPEAFLHEHQLLPLQQTIKHLHFPETIEQAEQAKHRLIFERLLLIQLTSLKNQLEYQQSIHDQWESIQINWDHIKSFLETLPFTLTWAQKRSLKESVEDIHDWRTMMRLLQWDVGSGKTIVAAALAYHIIKEQGGQIAFLAPLSVLALQHYQSLAKLLLPLWVRVEMLTWALTAKHKREIKDWLADGRIDLIVGTHAIIQEDVIFQNLQLAVIDEQHKFGVKQRAFFQRFDSPHLLQMTATPIPRSLTLAFFGEFEVSNIDEMPAGRLPIITKIVNNGELTKLKPWILTKIGQSQKVFIITPLIEESEHLEEVASVLSEWEAMVSLYPELAGKIGLLHGKMKSDQKDDVMKKFKEWHYVMLVSTTVIEVWIDIPDATAIIIKSAERFWLSQLHQLRGRVWRSDLQSYCFLQVKRKSGESFQRLKYLEQITDGFKLSEIDLQIRGTGEILGLRQSWDTDIPLDILTDTTYLQSVKEAGHWLIEHSPEVVDTMLSKSEIEGMGKMMV